MLALPGQAQTTSPASAPNPPRNASNALPDAPGASATLFGSVIDGNGNPLSNAVVSFTPATGDAPAPVQTAADGHFVFLNLPLGAYTLNVTLAGFTSKRLTGTLSPGTSGAVPPCVLIPAVSESVDAVDPEVVAARQIKVEEQQRLIGILPNFFVSYDWYTPALTTRQKYSLSLHSIIDPGTFISSAGLAGVQQATNAYPTWGQGAAGYGKRFGANTGDVVIGTMLGGAVLPSLFHQDPRYFYKGTGSIRSRIVYAITRAVIARGDNGKWQPAYASVLGDFSSGALSNLYYPKSSEHGALLTIENGFIGIGGDAFNGIMQEFVLRHVTPGTHKHDDPQTSQP